MNELRKQFEDLSDIKRKLISVKFNENLNKYESKNPTLIECIEVSLYVNGAWYAFQEQQKKIDLFDKMILSLRNEFNLWADDAESFNAIEVQIENLEELLK